MTNSGYIHRRTFADLERERIDNDINELRTILLVMMEPESAERFRRTWFPRPTEDTTP